MEEGDAAREGLRAGVKEAIAVGVSGGKDFEKIMLVDTWMLALGVVKKGGLGV